MDNNDTDRSQRTIVGSPGARMACVPFRAWNPSVVCDALVATGGSGGQQVAVRLRNAAGWPIPAEWGLRVRFAIQTGP